MKKQTKKKKILMYADSPGWAYDTIIQLITQNLGHKADFYFDYCCNHLYRQKTESFFSCLRKDLHRTFKNFKSLVRGNPLDFNYCLFFSYKVLPFWRQEFVIEGKKYRRRTLPPWKHYDVIYYPDFYFDFYAKLRKDAPYKVKGIFSDGFPPQCMDLDLLKDREGISESAITSSKSVFFNRYFKNIDLFVGGSLSILNEYKEFPIPQMMLVGIYKEEIFYENPNRTYDHNELIIGWTGNPNRAFKNFHTIIEPAIEQLKNEGYNIKLKTRFSGPYETLPDFYQDVDLVLVASSADAGPSLFAEAALCGVPAISTIVGYPSMIIQDGINGFFVEPEIAAFKEKIIYLYKNRDVLASFSKRIRTDYLQKLGQDVYLRDWEKAFLIS